MIVERGTEWEEEKAEGTGGDHTPLGFFFSMLQTQLFGSIKPQNKLCINLEVPISDYFQYK